LNKNENYYGEMQEKMLKMPEMKNWAKLTKPNPKIPFG